ncbi:hypothetical protein GUJ93_ZPchr0007g3877 [Zizania palustris]|uniref:Uncharacterized protein n=1 Tax=Zizania palustris TaxID=103762 RepID=A0A8J5VS41_ZIZPA|nr:hypothetical protein GUJ93_ZPchr0007g3877 [Zizania palustris]
MWAKGRWTSLHEKSRWSVSRFLPSILAEMNRVGRACAHTSRCTIREAVTIAYANGVQVPSRPYAYGLWMAYS